MGSSCTSAKATMGSAHPLRSQMFIEESNSIARDYSKISNNLSSVRISLYTLVLGLSKEHVTVYTQEIACPNTNPHVQEEDQFKTFHELLLRSNFSADLTMLHEFERNSSISKSSPERHSSSSSSRKETKAQKIGESIQRICKINQMTRSSHHKLITLAQKYGIEDGRHFDMALHLLNEQSRQLTAYFDKQLLQHSPGRSRHNTNKSAESATTNAFSLNAQTLSLFKISVPSQ